jgi:hypothetical protein
MKFFEMDLVSSYEQSNGNLYDAAHTARCIFSKQVRRGDR